MKIAKTIPGLGVAGASGLLALLFPTYFGTVDQFVVKSLVKVSELPEKSALKDMLEKIENSGSLSITDGVILIQIMRRKAAELNANSPAGTWTPRKIDMVLWGYRDDKRKPICCRNSR